MIEAPADRTHLETFRKAVVKLRADPWLGDSPHSFAERYHIDPLTLPNERQDRAQTRALVNDRALPITTAAIAVLAWGRMKKANADRFFATDRQACWDVAICVRAGQFDRQTSYAAFREVRAGAGMPGLGPAYFTKLIHFLKPADVSPTAHILDQWAGMSVNLIWGKGIASLVNYPVYSKNRRKRLARRVSDATTAEHYEDFCNRVDWLAKELQVRTEVIDRAFLSMNGDGGWREYLKNHYRDDR